MGRLARQCLLCYIYTPMNNKNKNIIVIVALFGAGAILFSGNYLIMLNQSREARELPKFSFPTVSLSAIKISPGSDTLVSTEAWKTFGDYLEYARTGNIEGVKSLSHQVSSVCSDPTRENECLSAMENVYAIASEFEAADFKNVMFDDKQILLYTDGPERIILYFTRTNTGAPRVLGIQFCLEFEGAHKCVETDPSLRDTDGNDWWDRVEALFY